MAGVSVPEHLRVRPGDAPSAARDNEVVRLAEALTLQRGGMVGRQEPGGFTPHISVSTSSQPDYNFRAVLDADENGKPVLTFLTPGHVGGVSPVIVTADGEEVAIDDTVDDAGTPPALPIPEDAFAKHGHVERALVMLRYDLNPTDGGSVQKVTVIAVPKVPDRKAWTWHRLCGYVLRQNDAARWVPLIFFSQQFEVSNVNAATGTFRAWPRIA